jgi:DNA-binding transcriptional LysR family regulator
VEQRVIYGDVDLRFVARRPRSRALVVNVVGEDSLALAVQRDHPLAVRSSVRLDELTKRTIVKSLDKR